VTRDLEEKLEAFWTRRTEKRPSASMRRVKLKRDWGEWFQHLMVVRAWRSQTGMREPPREIIKSEPVTMSLLAVIMCRLVDVVDDVEVDNVPDDERDGE
jgi:hypothetical protein